MRIQRFAGYYIEERMLVILVLKVKNTVEEEMDKSDSGNNCTGSFLDRLGWLEKVSLKYFLCTLCARYATNTGETQLLTSHHRDKEREEVVGWIGVWR